MLRFGVLGLTLVLDLSLVSVVVIGGVSDDLSATVGQENAVFAGHNLAVRVGVVAEIEALVVVLDGIGEVEWHSLLKKKEKITIAEYKCICFL